MSKTTVRKGKQDDKFSLAIREIQSSKAENKKCFDCDQRGPTYINMTVGSFVCTKCSGMLRGINPPHRIKSISMSSFTSEEVEMMRSRGNLWCAAVWLGTYDKSNQSVDFKDEEKIKEFIIAKYEKKRYYVEPGPATLSKVGINSSTTETIKTGSLTSSALIGSTLKARVDPSSALGPNISVSRPEPDRMHITIVPGKMPIFHNPSDIAPPTVPPPQPVTNLPAPVSRPSNTANNGMAIGLVQSHPPARGEEADTFQANFADFDTAAFESLPADPLTVPPAPLIAGQQATTKAQDKEKDLTSGMDRYSALKELDDLFKTSSVSSPGPDLFGQQESSSLFPEQPPPVFPDQYSGSTLFSPAPTTTAPVSVFPGTQGEQQHNGSPGWASAGWGGRASSPSNITKWGGPGVPAGIQGTPGTTLNWGPEAWPDATTTQSSHSTNPFGNSPSNPPAPASQLVHSDNNNDLFAAAPKPFISDKSGVPLGGDSNPWFSAPAFTVDMKPAPNPNNPFL